MACGHESGCGEPVYNKTSGLCRKHYWLAWRDKRQGDPDAPRCKTGDGRVVLANDLCGACYQREYRASRAHEERPECRVEQCHDPVKTLSSGLCEGHYRRLRRYGDPLGGPDLVKDHACSLHPDRRAVTRWMEDGELKGYLCSACDARWRKYGNPAEVPHRRANGEGTLSGGYLVVGSGGPRPRRKHRLLMEQLLGRPLTDKEDVHHVNGQKADNTIAGPLVNYRSGNLELWSTKQPRGQRVSDKIEFAVLILREYAPEYLSPEGRLAEFPRA